MELHGTSIFRRRKTQFFQAVHDLSPNKKIRPANMITKNACDFCVLNRKESVEGKNSGATLNQKQNIKNKKQHVIFKKKTQFHPPFYTQVHRQKICAKP